MLAQRFVALQQLMAAQQQFSEINHPFAVALGFILGIQLDAFLRVIVVSLSLTSADALFLVRVDELAEFAWRVFFVVNVEIFQQALDHRQLIAESRIWKDCGRPASR
jgi:hypothetical protein